MLDQMAERYGKLPSEVLTTATTFDLFVFDASVSYKNLLQRRANGEKDEIPQEVILKKWKKFHEDKSKNSK